MTSPDRHPIVLHALKPLYQQMRHADRLRVQFEYIHPNNQARFVVVFLADTAPFQLALVAKGARPFAAVFDVQPGFKVDPWIADFHRLMDVLGIRPGTTRFRVSHFLQEALAAAPKHVGQAHDASPAVLVRIHPDVEEADKIYFKHFIDHNGNGRHPRRTNLDKTRRLLGEDCYDFCRRRNISSAWSAQPSDEQPYLRSIARIVPE
ncbi:DUF6037 family protein [Mycobacterium sp. NPDC049093]